MNKLISIIGVLAAVLVIQAQAISPVNEGASGTTSATAFVRQGSTDVVELTDVAWKVDSSNTSATINIRQGKKRYAVTSATSASGTVIYFDNSSSGVAVGDYVIYDDVSAATLYLFRCSAAATTSVTSYSTITPACATSDYVWAVNANVARPSPDQTTSSTLTIGSIFLPGQQPTALTLDGNTTSCRISVSGVRR